MNQMIPACLTTHPVPFHVPSDNRYLENTHRTEIEDNEFSNDDLTEAMDIDLVPEVPSPTTLTPESSPEPISIPVEVDPDPWHGFDEFQDLDTPVTLDEMIQQLDDMLGPDQEAAHWDARNTILTDEDCDNIQAFKLKMISHMPRTAYNQMVYAFSHKLELSSEWVMLHRMAILSGIQPVWYHCCINSCAAYTAAFSDLSQCAYCQEPRFSPTGKPRHMFCYVPIIPRLQGFFLNLKTINALLYRHNYQHAAGTISDVFDGEHYQTLLTKKVVVDGQTLPHTYFSGMYDICLGVALDSYLLFKRNRAGPSATPILIQNYSIEPDIRTHRDSTIYLVPYDEECAQLARGVRTFNAETRDHFMLRAYNIFEMGDIIAIEKSLNIKGHNSFCPCRSCEIRGIRNKTGNEKLYYMPFTWPNGRYWDPEKRATVSRNTMVSKGSQHFDAWDLMHIVENVVPNLYKLWSGKFKGLDMGTENYQIPDNAWVLIWQETADAVKHIPADFVHVLGNIPAYYTAEAWFFWFIHLAPILLEGRFPDPKYHTHLCQLSRIFKTYLSFTITHDEIDELKTNIIDWIAKYEEYYYQHDEDRLRACPLTYHGLIHIPDDIRFCGPSWTTWTFWVERYCGFLQSGLRSRRFPWANLNNNILHVAYLEQLGVRYDLDDELSCGNRQNSTLSKEEYDFDSYDQAVLRLPYKRNYIPDEDIRKLKIMPSFGKLRIIDGDSFRTASASGDGSVAERNMSFIRYEIETRRTAAEPWVPRIFYGQLERILICQLPEDSALESISGKYSLSGKKHLLAVITPCTHTQGKDASQEITSYRDLAPAPIVTDLQSVVAVVGRAETRGSWKIIDRTGGIIRPQFVIDEGVEEE
ncbi:hypothetical protein C8J57DRAFT_1253129 [Mycena rebaudengoi]|nr:hypothetical protein C8J57DRAFT_1253129 [Mycena rebaudengoi]